MISRGSSLGTRALCTVLACAFALVADALAADVLVVGDSMMKPVARALKKECIARDLSVEIMTSIGSGLARLDLLDWHTEVRALVEAHEPKTAFVMMGTNDNQPMQMGDATLPFGGEGWKMEYGRRAGKLMDILVEEGAVRVVWIGLPCMRESDLDADAKTISRIVEQQAAARPQVRFLPTYRRFSKKGAYSAYIIQSSGMPLDVRASDGIHLNRKGAELLATLVMTEHDRE